MMELRLTDQCDVRYDRWFVCWGRCPVVVLVGLGLFCWSPRTNRGHVSPTQTLLRMPELVLTHSIPSFLTVNITTSNYACLLVGYVEEHEMLCDYIGIKPDLYKRYMDNVGGAASCTKDDLTQFLTFASNYPASQT